VQSAIPAKCARYHWYSSEKWHNIIQGKTAAAGSRTFNMTGEGAGAEAASSSQGGGDGRGHGESPGSPASQTFRGVEIIDARGNPLGEFDEIAAGIFIEEKLAIGLGQLHPRTGRPVQTIVQWAEKQIFQKTVVRLDNLQRAVATRPAAGGSPYVPALSEILEIRKFQFKIVSTAPEVQNAVQTELTRLRARFPVWEFSVIFGP
jgi:hypothetical protein